MRTKYTPPPEAVYLAGKKKERTSKAISLLKLVLSDVHDRHENVTLRIDLDLAIKSLTAYRKRLDE